MTRTSVRLSHNQKRGYCRSPVAVARFEKAAADPGVARQTLLTVCELIDVEKLNIVVCSLPRYIYASNYDLRQH
jgi:hypothetical protein